MLLLLRRRTVPDVINMDLHQPVVTEENRNHKQNVRDDLSDYDGANCFVPLVLDEEFDCQAAKYVDVVRIGESPEKIRKGARVRMMQVRDVQDSS